MTIRAENPVILIGAGRSGTSLLHEILSAHPDIRMMGEFMFATYDLWRALWSNPAPANEMTWRYLRRAYPDRYDEVSDDLILSAAHQWTISERRRVGGIIRSALDDRFELAKSAESFWGFKEIWIGRKPDHSWEPFDAIYPEALYVHLVRHPFHFARSVAAWNRRPFQLDDLRATLAAWVCYLRKNQERESIGRYLRVKYEQLTSAPQPTITNLLRRLGLDLHPGCLLPLGKSHLASSYAPAWPSGACGLIESIEGLAESMRELGYDRPDIDEGAPGIDTAGGEGSGPGPIAVPIDDSSRRWRLVQPYVREEGHAWQIPLSTEPQLRPLAQAADSLDRPEQSPLRLFEDGVALEPPHSVHRRIRQVGGGRFSHWSEGHVLLFSTSDNSDPNQNGREYSVSW